MLDVIKKKTNNAETIETRILELKKLFVDGESAKVCKNVLAKIFEKMETENIRKFSSSRQRVEGNELIVLHLRQVIIREIRDNLETMIDEGALAISEIHDMEGKPE